MSPLVFPTDEDFFDFCKLKKVLEGMYMGERIHAAETKANIGKKNGSLHVCEACGQTIPKGKPLVRLSGDNITGREDQTYRWSRVVCNFRCATKFVSDTIREKGGVQNMPPASSHIPLPVPVKAEVTVERWVVTEYSGQTGKAVREFFYTNEADAVKEYENDRNSHKFAGGPYSNYLGYPQKHIVGIPA